MKNILAAIFFALSGATASYAADAPKAPSEPAHSPAQEAISIGLPLNTSGISVANRPNVINFVTVMNDNSISINWDNVCKLTKSQPFSLQTLSRMQNNIEEYILPYALVNANPDKCK